MTYVFHNYYQRWEVVIFTENVNTIVNMFLFFFLKESILAAAPYETLKPFLFSLIIWELYGSSGKILHMPPMDLSWNVTLPPVQLLAGFTTGSLVSFLGSTSYFHRWQKKISYFHLPKIDYKRFDPTIFQLWR